MQEVLVNRLVKLAQEKNVIKGTDSPNMTIAVDLSLGVKLQIKQKSFL